MAAKSTSSRRSSGSSAKTTVDHGEIQQWVEERGGHPACVKGTGGKGDTGLLRIDYPGYSGEETLQEITWDEFFDKFDEQKLAMVYQTKTSGGEESRFSKLVSRASARRKGTSHPGQSSRRSASNKSNGKKTVGKKTSRSSSSARGSARSASSGRQRSKP